MYKYIVFPGNNAQIIKDTLQKRGWQEAAEDSMDANFMWKQSNFPVSVYARVNRDCKNIQILNHFENHRGLCTKTGLIQSLRRYFSDPRYPPYDIIPTSFVISSSVEDHELAQFITRYKSIARGSASQERMPVKHCTKNMWLVKPAALNQGKGIEVFKDLSQIINFLTTRQPKSLWLVQKYIERPLLFAGRKFDIRIWVLFTNRLDVFMYEQGYLRTSSDVYDTESKDNYVHLTNNCLQKYGDNYGRWEEGNTLSFASFQSYLDETFPEQKIDFEAHLIPRMKDLIVDTFLSVRSQLNQSNRKHNFELFGYDFMVDEDFRVWLIEVNTNPYLGVSCKYISNLLPEMIDDVFRINVDPILPPPNHYCTDRRNGFVLLHSDGASPYSEQPFSCRRPLTTSPYPHPEVDHPLFRSHSHSSKSPLLGPSSTATAVRRTGSGVGSVHRFLSRAEGAEDEMELNRDGHEEGSDEENKTKSKSGPQPYKAGTKDLVKMAQEALYLSSGLESECFLSVVKKIFSVLTSSKFGSLKMLEAMNALQLTVGCRAGACAITELNQLESLYQLLKDTASSDLKRLAMTCFLKTSTHRPIRQFITVEHICLITELALISSDKAIQLDSIKTLCHLAEKKSRGRNYIPGESRWADLNRSRMLEAGSFLALLHLSLSDNEEIKRLIGDIWFNEFSSPDVDLICKIVAAHQTWIKAESTSSGCTSVRSVFESVGLDSGVNSFLANVDSCFDIYFSRVFAANRYVMTVPTVMDQSFFERLQVPLEDVRQRRKEKAEKWQLEQLKKEESKAKDQAESVHQSNRDRTRSNRLDSERRLRSVPPRSSQQSNGSYERSNKDNTSSKTHEHSRRQLSRDNIVVQRPSSVLENNTVTTVQTTDASIGGSRQSTHRRSVSLRRSDLSMNHNGRNDRLSSTRTRSQSTQPRSESRVDPIRELASEDISGGRKHSDGGREDSDQETFE
eukprot:GILK01004995.1.p1 GENE.GILK01004995.1~~GILK01004995.1.p1  ORF type:complete len:998 (+),score=200.20 GILK01004995.1:113-2995(+)